MIPEVDHNLYSEPQVPGHRQDKTRNESPNKSYERKPFNLYKSTEKSEKSTYQDKGMKMFYDSRERSNNPSEITSNVAESRNEAYGNIISEN
jgi:hypothetical protein